MDIELLGQLGQRLLTLDGSYRHLRLEGRAVVRRGRLNMVAPRFSAIFLPISSGFTTQSPRSDFPSHLCVRRCWRARQRHEARTSAPPEHRFGSLFPVCVELKYDPTAEAKQEAPKQDAEDAEEAREWIAGGGRR
jgi:hypothetical protein